MKKLVLSLLFLVEMPCILGADLAQPIAINTANLNDFYNAIREGKTKEERLDIVLNAFLASNQKTLSELLNDPTANEQKVVNNRMRFIANSVSNTQAVINNLPLVTELENYAKAASLSIEYNTSTKKDKRLLTRMWDTLRFSEVGRFVAFATRKLSPEDYTSYAAAAQTPKQLLATIKAAKNVDKALAPQDIALFQRVLLDKIIQSKNREMFSSFEELSKDADFLLNKTLQNKLTSAQKVFNPLLSHEKGIFTEEEMDYDFDATIDILVSEIKEQDQRKIVDFFYTILFENKTLSARLEGNIKNLEKLTQAVDGVERVYDPETGVINSCCQAKNSYDAYIQSLEPVHITNFWTALESARKVATKVSDVFSFTLRFLRKMTGTLQPKDYLAFARRAETPEQLAACIKQAKAADENPKNQKIITVGGQTINQAEKFLNEFDIEIITRAMVKKIKSQILAGDSTLLQRLEESKLLNRREFNQFQDEIDKEKSQQEESLAPVTTTTTKSLKEQLLSDLKKEVDGLSVDAMITDIQNTSQKTYTTPIEYFRELLKLDLYSQKIAAENTNRALLVTQKGTRPDFSMANMLPQNAKIAQTVIDALKEKRTELTTTALGGVQRELQNLNVTTDALTSQIEYDKTTTQLSTLKELLDFLPVSSTKTKILELYTEKSTEVEQSAEKNGVKKAAQQSDDAFGDDADETKQDTSVDTQGRKSPFNDAQTLQKEAERFLNETLQEIKSDNHITVNERYEAFTKLISGCDDAVLKQLQLPDDASKNNNALDRITEAVFGSFKTADTRALVESTIKTKIAFSEKTLINFWTKSKALIKTKLINNPFVSLCKYLFTKIDIAKRIELLYRAPTVTDLLQARDAFYLANPNEKKEPVFIKELGKNIQNRISIIFVQLDANSDNADARKALYEVRAIIKANTTTLITLDQQNEILRRIKAIDDGQLRITATKQDPRREQPQPKGSPHGTEEHEDRASNIHGKL